MAGSKFAYVRNFELPDPILPETFMVLRLDGHSFHQYDSIVCESVDLRTAQSFSDDHRFKKPNDERALQLMDAAAISVMEEFTDIVLAFGESDEFRSVFPS
jgi:tRNA(His) guanylyltransferase